MHPNSLNNLVPFTPGDPRAAAGRQLGAAAISEAAALRRARITEAKEMLDALVIAFSRERLGAACAAAAQAVVGGIVSGDIPVRNGHEAAEVIDALATVARLEEGSPTSLAVTATLSTEDALARIGELRRRAQEVQLLGTRQKSIATGDGES